MRAEGLERLASSLGSSPDTLQLIVDGLTQPPGFDIRQSKTGHTHTLTLVVQGVGLTSGCYSVILIHKQDILFWDGYVGGSPIFSWSIIGLPHIQLVPLCLQYEVLRSSLWSIKQPWIAMKPELVCVVIRWSQKENKAVFFQPNGSSRVPRLLFYGRPVTLSTAGHMGGQC